MIVLQFLYNSNNLFFFYVFIFFILRSTIKFLGPTCRKTDLMIDHKKKIKKQKKVVRVVQKLYENYARNITLNNLT
jgi:hypothetical protein